MLTQVSWAKPAGLAAILVALGGLVYWLEDYDTQKSDREEASKKLMALKEVVIESLSLVSPDKTVSFRCLDVEQGLCKPGNQSSWEITAPETLGADKTNVNSLISAINNIRAGETLDLSEDSPEKRKELMKGYGLSEEARKTGTRLEIVGGGMKRVAYFGDTHPIGNRIFAVVEENGKLLDERVVLVGSYFKSNFEKKVSHWRNKKVMDLAAHDVEKFEYTSPKAKGLSFTKEEGKWIIRKGKAELPGDIENIDNLLSAVTHLSAKDFAADRHASKAGKRALKWARKTVSFKLFPKGEEAKPLEVNLYERKKDGKIDKLLAKTTAREALYELNTSSASRLTKGMKDLRLSKLITSLERFSAKRLSFESQELGKMEMEKKDNTWTSNSGSVNSDRIKTLLDRISGNKIEDFLARSPKGQETGITMVLGDEKTPEKRKLLLWQDDGNLYARDLNSKRKEAFRLKGSVKNALPWKKDFFTAKAADNKPKEPNQLPKGHSHGDGHNHGHGHGHGH